jgi:hypothetical protein
MITTTARVVVVFLIALSSIAALPTGAPVCTIDFSAVNNLHLAQSRNPQTGPLSNGDFIVTVNGNITLVPGVALEIPAQRDVQVVVTSESGIQPFKGVLVILSAPNILFTDELFTREAILQNSIACQGTGNRVGVTHRSNVTKTKATVFLNIPNNYEEVRLDVNMVIVNNDIASIYYYDRFLLKVTGATEAPTPTPRPECGLFGLSLFCIRIFFCGYFGRLLFGDSNCY